MFVLIYLAIVLLVLGYAFNYYKDEEIESFIFSSIFSSLFFPVFFSYLFFKWFTTPTYIICPKCNRKNLVKAKFCGNCGIKFNK